MRTLASAAPPTLAAPPAPGGDATASDATGALWHNRSAARIARALWIVALLAIAFTLNAAASLILPILLAAVLSLLLSPAVGLLVRWRVPQALAAALVVTALVAAVVVLAAHLYAPVQRWANAGPAEVRMLEHKLRILRRPVEAVREAGDKVAQLTGSETERTVAVERKGTALEWARTTQHAVFTTLTTALLLYFLLASGDLFLRKTVRVIPRLRDKIRAVEIARRVQHEIASYFAVLTLINVGFGAAVGVAMWALGMPTPLLWAVVAALTNFLPYIGPFVGVVVIGVAAVVSFDTPLAMLAPPLAYLVLHLVEDQVILPVALGRRLAVSPVVIFIWVLVWTWMWGVVGVVLAVPLLVAVRICAEHIPALAPLAAFLAREDAA
jgi:predicted PurR-regulated permease PerM